MRPTRFYSNRQEKSVAKAVKGRQTPNSGATSFIKSDILTDLFAIECKTVTTEKKSVSIKKDWLTKNKEEAFEMGKSYSALAFNFEPGGENYYVVDERLFKILNEYLQESET